MTRDSGRSSGEFEVVSFSRVMGRGKVTVMHGRSFTIACGTCAVATVALLPSAYANFTSAVSGANSGLCLDVEGAATADRANIIQWTCHGGANQQINFRLVIPTQDTYTLVFAHSNKCVDVDGASTANGANIHQYTCNGTGAQSFRLVQRGANYALVNTNSNKVIEVQGDSRINLGNIQQGDDLNADYQSFAVPGYAPPGPSAGPNVVGQWGPVIQWPLIPVSMANLPDGRVLTWSGSERETWPTPEQNYSTIWDPETNSFTDLFTIGHNMFCAHLAMMADGRVFVNGGRNQANTPYVSLFDWRTTSWTQIENMASGGRWYPTTVALADGDIFTSMGSASLPRVPERWDERDGWIIQNGINFGTMVLDPYPGGQFGERNWWPLLHVAPNGKLFHSGPTPDMHWINTTGQGSFEQVGPQLTSFYHKHGATVMYDEGRILTAGGWESGTDTRSVADAFTVDINGPAPVVQTTSPMNSPRKFHVGVMMPNGQVLVLGGNTSGIKFSDAGAVLEPEWWDPATGQWQTGAPATIARGYHSTGILLTDGRVLSAGGGYCAGSRTCNGSSHPDGQIFSPPYLFDASGALAARPTLSGAPQVIVPGVPFEVQTGGSIAYFSLIKMSSNTHALTTDLRYLRPTMTAVGTGRYSLAPHANPNVLTPGYWMLFAVDTNGVPSVAAVVRAATLESDYRNLAEGGIATQSSVDTSSPGMGPDAALDGDMTGTPASSLSRTQTEASPYWQVDLRSAASIHSVRVWNRTDADTADLRNFYVFVSTTPMTSSDLATIRGQAGVYEVHVPGGIDRLGDIRIGQSGRYVRIQLAGTANLNLAEVQVFGDDNLALGGVATQSSDYPPTAEFAANKAIDGRRSGDSASHSLSHTQSEAEAWWHLDLQNEAAIEDVTLWNRTDCCAGRLSNFSLFVSSDPFTSTTVAGARSQPGVAEYQIASLSGDSVTIPVNRNGRYLRVQLRGTNFLTLAEVEVRGTRPRLSVDPSASPPQPVNTTLNFSATAIGSPPIEYAWTFGDGNGTAFSTDPSASHIYAAPGRYVVTLQARDGSGDSVQSSFIQVIHRPATARAPTASGTVIFEGSGAAERVWNVNPDNDTVTVHTSAGAFLSEIAVGDAPWSLAKVPTRNEVWVVNKGDATISVVDTVTLSVIASIELPLASMPHGLAFAQDTSTAYVALEGTGEVLRLNAGSRTSNASVTLGGAVRHVSVSGDGANVFVSRFITPPLPDEDTANPIVSDAFNVYGGEVVALTAGLTSPQTIVLQHSTRAASEHSGPGIPNYLGPAVIAPDGVTAWVASKQDNILAGDLRGGIGITFDQTVRAISSVFDLALRQENLAGRIDHDNASIARDAAFGPHGAYLFTALEGNREIAVSDTFDGNELFRFDVGRAPQAVAASADGHRLAVHNFMDRTVGIYDVTSVVEAHDQNVTQIALVPTVAAETLSAQVLLGKQLFYDARDDRLALDDYMACASCHNDGGQDGRVWDFTGLGEGLRNTIELNGRGGMAHGILHWTGNFDEVQDFENQIRDFAGGLGLMADGDFASTQAVLGPPKAGLSADLDALAAYVSSLQSPLPSPFRGPNGLSAAGQAGRSLYLQHACGSCHAGTVTTDSPTGVRHDVGTLKSGSGGRLGGTLDGLDTPTLVDVWSSAPYLHDGSAATLEDAVAAHTSIVLTATERTQLAAFLNEFVPGDLTTDVFEAEGLPTDHVVRSVALAGFIDPIVVLSPPTYNGGHPSTMRIFDVSPSQFDYALQEWMYLDGNHTSETTGYLAIENGAPSLGALPADAGRASVTNSWTTVSFATAFGATPVVLAQVASNNEADTVAPRIRNVSPTSFQIFLEEEEASPGAHAAETVHWIAVEPGTTVVNGRSIAVGRTGDVHRHPFLAVPFGGSYANPVFFAAMQTHDGGDTSALRIRNLTATSVDVKVEEEQSANSETNHTTEVVGYIVVGR